MKSPHILRLNKNVVELKRELSNVLGARGAKAFDADVRRNVVQLYSLGVEHFQFAKKLAPRHWRQIVSRSYYGAYGLSKALRLAVSGHYSQEVKDHEKVGELPNDFPDQSLYANKLRLLRDDRNLCDYDHTVLEADLAASSADTLRLVENLAAHASAYLKARAFPV